MLEIHPGVLAKLIAALGEEALSTQELAGHIGFDAPLTLAFLKCAKQAHEQNLSENLSLADAINRLGPEFIRALLLSARPRPLEQHVLWESGIRVAYLARRLAAHTRVCNEDQAWLAGLAHNLAAYPGFDQPNRLNEWLQAADPSGFVGDAVRFCRASPARVKSAHPLVRILQLAASLIYSEHVNGNVGVRASMASLGLDVAIVERLQNEADYLAQEAVHRYSSQENAPGVSREGLIQAYAAVARASTLNEYLRLAASLESLPPKAGLVMRALFGINTCLVLHVEGNLLVPVPWWPAAPALSALALPAKFVQSALSRAACGETVYWHESLADQFPVVDAQVARLLGAESLLCAPLDTGSNAQAVLLVGNVDEAMAGWPVWKEFLRALSGRIAELQGSVASMPADADAIPRQEVRNAVHEASNPLTIIRNYVNLLSSKFAADKDTQRDLAIVGGEIERVAAILQGLGVKRETDKGAEPVRGTWVDVNQVISELVRMSLDTLFLPNKVNVQIDLDPGLGSILTQRDQLKQVLLNLAKNAVEAMPRGGKLSFASTRAELGGQRSALITVQDTGSGLPEHVRQQLFQPAVSTKGGEHAGLGLYISSNLVKSMGGDIECDSSPSGSTFRIYLPMAETEHNAAVSQPGSQRK